MCFSPALDLDVRSPMTAKDAPSPESTSPSPGAGQRFSAVRMPIEEPVEDFDAAVEELRQCSSTELHRARTRHRRALESLQNGGYHSLSAKTREHLVGRLRNNLAALNQALDDASAQANGSTETNDDQPSSFSSRFRTLFQGLW